MNFILSTMYIRIDNILREMWLKVRKLFDAEKTMHILVLNTHVYGYLKAKNYSLVKQIV
jgi:hypothetical protein